MSSHGSNPEGVPSFIGLEVGGPVAATRMKCRVALWPLSDAERICSGKVSVLDGQK